MKIKNLIGIKFKSFIVISYNSLIGNRPKWNCLCECGREYIFDARQITKSTPRDCICMKNSKIMGRRIGKLKILELAFSNENGQYWNCLCDCGKFKIIKEYDLLRKRNIKSCGCLISDIGLDLTDKIFGKLKVSKFHGREKSIPKWLCECECGNTSIVKQESLTSGYTKTCGCSFRRKGKNHPLWKEAKNNDKRNSQSSKKWRREILKKFNHRCVITGNCENLRCHHLDGYSSNPEKQFLLNNGVVICEEYHKKFHMKYGYGDNTADQFNEFYLEHIMTPII